jgi:hypothetical protein
VALLSVDEVREFVGIAHEEHRRVVADQMPIAFLGIEFQCEAAHVALGIGRAEFAREGREARDSSVLACTWPWCIGKCRR